MEPNTATPVPQEPVNNGVLNPVVLNTGALNTSALNTSALNTSALNTSALNTSALSTSALTTSALTTSALSTCVLNTSVLNTSLLNTNVLNTSVLNNSVLNNGVLPVAVIKTEINVDERGTSNNSASVADGSEEVTPSPTTGDEQPLNPWLTVKCIFCHVTLSASEEPKLLECLHAACGNCITTKINEHIPGETELSGESSSVVCPLCHVMCRTSNIIENHFLVENQPTISEDGNDSSKFNELKCGSCPDTAATSWCVECAEFICDGCVQAHQRLKITKEHTIKPKEEGEPDNHAPATGTQHKSLFCSVHRQERLSLFCETCDRLTCRDCQLSDHRDHKYKFINEIAQETRNMISGLLSEVSYKRVLLKSAMKVIDDRQNLIIEKKKQLVKEITQMVVKLTNTINARGKQLVVRLNEVCDGKQKTLNEKKLALEQLSALTDHCIDFVNMALSRGSDMALLFSKTNLTTHLQRIKSRRADIPNPEIPVRINLALDKVPDLIKVASTIGSIIVDGRIYPPPTNGSAGGPVAPPPATRQYTSPPGPPPYHNRVSPLQGLAQMPSQLQQRNMHHTRSPHHPQQVMKSQGSGTVHHTQQQVTSSTHPYNNSHHEANLRGLLAHHSYHQNGYSPHGIRATSPQAAIAGPSMPLYRMAGGGQLPPPLPQRYMHSQHTYTQQQVTAPTTAGPVSWHIPQQPMAGQYGGGGAGSPSPAKPTPPHPSTIDESYKITLKQPTPPSPVDQKPVLPHPPFVSSSVPKTPSPHTQAKAQDDAEKSLDKFCQESVNDLMMTIAKLDSNGIMVIPEKGADSLVDSSTGPPIDRPSTSTAGNAQTTPSSQGSLDSQKDDPNEDWCAVCLDGGEPVLCCDNCPKVFHLKCHIPALSAFPGESETWQCLLCTSMSNVTPNIQVGEKRPHRDGLDAHEQMLMQRILLELYCQYEPSLHFREVIPPDNVAYHEKIKRPMSFDMIRQKLASTSSDRYRNMKEVVDDIRLVFKNAYTFNPKESQVYSDAKSLEEFLDMLLEKWVPALAYDDTDTEPSMPKRVKRATHD